MPLVGSKVLLPLATAALVALPAAAEPEPSGTWQARFATDADGRCTAELVVDVDRGRWTSPPCGREPRGCAGAAYDATLANIGSSTLTLTLRPPGAGTGRRPACTARLTVVDHDTLEGEFDDGRVLRLERSASPG